MESVMSRLAAADHPGRELRTAGLGDGNGRDQPSRLDEHSSNREHHMEDRDGDDGGLDGCCWPVSA